MAELKFKLVDVRLWDRPVFTFWANSTTGPECSRECRISVPVFQLLAACRCSVVGLAWLLQGAQLQLHGELVRVYDYLSLLAKQQGACPAVRAVGGARCAESAQLEHCPSWNLLTGHENTASHFLPWVLQDKDTYSGNMVPTQSPCLFPSSCCSHC